jgi:predicted metalloprotease
MDRIENEASNNSSLVACIHCRRNVFTETLTSTEWRDKINGPVSCNERGHTYIDSDWWEEFLNYAVKMSSLAMIYTPSFIKVGSGIQKLTGRIHRHTDRMEIS